TFFKIATKTLEDDEETTLEMAWAPGQDIPGNEKADALVKEACTMHHLGQRTYANARRRLRERCRTGHAHVGEYYELFNILEATDCECGERLQTREHIIRTCPRYSDYRQILQEGSQNQIMCDLLGTTEGIEAVASFLAESGAFTKTGNPRREVGMPLWEDEPEPDEPEEE
ncbi:hypothetical protein ARMGADRAFT_1015910, partial [Armillaria gallica]